MRLEAYLECVKQGEIPPEPPPPTACSFGLGKYVGTHEARRECTIRGMWCVVDQQWTHELADWIGDRRVLEVMAGAGWLAAALHSYGVEIVATDDDTWADRHTKANPVYPVLKMDALDAITAYPDAEVLLMSWPPYANSIAAMVAHAWGPGRPLVYIGENEGGCNATDEFFQLFREDVDLEFPMMQWRGLHDRVQVGGILKD